MSSLSIISTSPSPPGTVNEHTTLLFIFLFCPYLSSYCGQMQKITDPFCDRCPYIYIYKEREREREREREKSEKQRCEK